MSSSIIQRSNGGTHVRSLGGTKNMPPGNSIYQLVHAFVPIWGFGLFQTAASTDQQDDSWPYVWSTLTETYSYDHAEYVDVNGSVLCTPSTRQRVFTKFIDTGMIDSGGPGNPITRAPFVNNFEVDSTFLSQDRTYIRVIFSFDASPDGTNIRLHGTYEARLSHLFGSVGEETWQSRTDDAMAILNAVDIPPLNASGYPIQCAYPVSTGSGVALGITQLLLAASYGLAVRGVPTQNTEPFMVFPSLADSPAFPVTFVANTGGVVCSKSIWGLLGAAPIIDIFSGDDWNQNNHYSVWGQGMALVGNPPLPVMLPAGGAKFASFARPTTVTFTPNEVQSFVTAPYGLLGFRTPPPTVSGAGNIGPGAGGGAPPI